MKLFERNEARESLKHLPETHEDLPELPGDVTVPEDVSGITHPETKKLYVPASGIRWMRWLPVAILVVAAAIVAALVLRDDGADTDVLVDPAFTPNSAEATNGELTRADYLPPTAGEVYNYNPITVTYPAPEAGGPTTEEYLPPTSGEVYNLPTVVAVPLDGYAIAEANRMNTLHELAIALPVDGYAIAEANRMNTLHELAITPEVDGYAIAEANRMETLRDL